MFNFIIKKNKGFTLVETMVAVFILSMIIISLMSVVSNSLFTSRYSRDEITANYLMQEAIDYIRNDRDASVFLVDEINDIVWQDFIDKYQNCTEPEGCYIDIFAGVKDPYLFGNIKKCDPVSGSNLTNCPVFFFNPNSTNSFYNYNQTVGTPTNFRRKISFTQNPSNTNEIIVKATVYWINGDISKSRSLQTSLLKW